MTAVAATEQETASISAYGPARSTVSGQPLVVVNKSSAVTRIPPDVKSLLSVADHCLKSENYVDVILCDKQMHLMNMNEGPGWSSSHAKRPLKTEEARIGSQ